MSYRGALLVFCLLISSSDCLAKKQDDLETLNYNVNLTIPTLEEALKLSPNDALVNLLLGIAYEENKQLSSAITRYKQALKLEPENILLKSNLGFACYITGDYKCASQNLSVIISEYPTSIRTRAVLGIVYHLLKNYNLAKEHYLYILSYLPDNVDILYNLAKVELALGEYNNAKENLDKAITLKPDFIDPYLDRAKANYKLGDLRNTEEDYLKAVNRGVVNPVVHEEYANFLYRTGAYLKASEQIKEALKFQPDDENLHFKKAFFLQLANKFNEAEKEWQNIILKNPRNIDALFNLAILYEETQYFEKAINAYKRILAENLKENKLILEAKSRLAYSLHKNNDYEEAKNIYEEILREMPRDPVILFNLGILLATSGEYKEAVHFLEKSVKNDFMDPKSIYKTLISIYEKLNDTLNLDIVYKKLLEIDKENLDVRMAYAEFLKESGNIQQALNQYLTSAAFDTSGKTKLKLAHYLLNERDLYGAIGQIQEYLKDNTDDLDALILLASAYQELGIVEEAINTYKKIISIDAVNHLAYYNLGVLCEKAKRNNEAENYLLKSIELNDNFAPAYYALGISHISQNNRIKAQEVFKKYLLLDPNGQYKDNVTRTLEEFKKTDISRNTGV